MNYIDLTENEKQFVDKLTDEQKAIYMAKDYDLAQLTVMATRIPTGKGLLTYFVDISYLILELHEQHQRFNDNMDRMATVPNNTEERQQALESFNDANDRFFTCNLNIGQKSVALFLSDMDSTDKLYEFLTDLKMQTYDRLFDCFTTVDFSEYL